MVSYTSHLHSYRSMFSWAVSSPNLWYILVKGLPDALIRGWCDHAQYGTYQLKAQQIPWWVDYQTAKKCENWHYELGIPEITCWLKPKFMFFLGSALLWLQDVQWHILHWRWIIYVASPFMCSWRDNTFLTLTSPFIIEKDGQDHCYEYFEGSDGESFIHGMYTCCCWFFSSYFFIVSPEKIMILQALHAVFQPFSLPFFLGFLHLLFYFSWYSQHCSWVFPLLPFLWKKLSMLVNSWPLPSARLWELMKVLGMLW